MKNALNLPEVVAFAIEAAQARYDRGHADYTATDLCLSPRQFWLGRRHEEAIRAATDVSDCFHAFLGQAMHQLLQHAQEEPASISEERLYRTLGVQSIGGRPDHLELYPDGTLRDWKFTSGYATTQKLKPEWERQVNVYRWLVEGMGPLFVPKRQEVVAFYYDAKRVALDDGRQVWQTHTRYRSVDLPSPIEVFEVPIDPKIEDWIRERVNLLESHRDTPDDELPDCTREERWQKADQWAVVGEGNGSALTLCYSETDAISRAEEATTPDRWAVVRELGGRAIKLHDNLKTAYTQAHNLGARVEHRPGRSYRVEHRPGLPVRCAGNWCGAARAGVCGQWKP